MGPEASLALFLDWVKGLAFDSAGNLFAADNADQTIFKFTPGGTSSIFAGPSAFTSNSGHLPAWPSTVQATSLRPLIRTI